MAFVANPDTEPLTQTQTQTWSQPLMVESQPIHTIWGRLHAKNQRYKSLDLWESTFVVGRNKGCDVCLDKLNLPEKVLAGLSKEHFRIDTDLSSLYHPVFITDLSRNGTFVNSTKLGFNKRQILQNQDCISITHPTYKVFLFQDLRPKDGIDWPKEISSNFYVTKQLGSGASGTVRLVYDKYSCLPYAMKHVVKNRLIEASSMVAEPRTNHRIMNEVSIMEAIRHPCIIKMHQLIETDDSMFMILELMEGGDLLTRIVGNGRLSEVTSKLYFYQICLAVKHLHARNITHRDIKPDNILLFSSDEETLVKVSDFGLSKHDSFMQTVCGTPHYAAPEIMDINSRHTGLYTQKVDIWSLGVVLFTCLSGMFPFVNNENSVTRYQFQSNSWKNISPTAETLIRKLLTVDPVQRPSIDAIIKDKWLHDRHMFKTVTGIMKKNYDLIRSTAAAAAVTVTATSAVTVTTNTTTTAAIASTSQINVESKAPIGAANVVTPDAPAKTGHPANSESDVTMEEPPLKRARIR